jgi:hypothetical protein
MNEEDETRQDVDVEGIRCLCLGVYVSVSMSRCLCLGVSVPYMSFTCLLPVSYLSLHLSYLSLRLYTSICGTLVTDRETPEGKQTTGDGSNAAGNV